MRPRSPRRGRPPLGDKARKRVSFTLSAIATSVLDDLARDQGGNASRVIEKLILANSKNALAKVGVTRDQVADVFKRRGIQKAWLFGSILRPDFSAASDVDLLVHFKKGACKGYFEFLDVKHELEDLIKRPVDLVEERLLENPIRREEILSHRQALYGV